MASPPQKEYGGLPHPTILAACYLLGIDEVYAVGGAQAIAMFAYGAKGSAMSQSGQWTACCYAGTLLCMQVIQEKAMMTTMKTIGKFRFFAAICSVLFVFTLVSTFGLSLNEAYAQGDGSSENPYIISDETELVDFISATQSGAAVYAELGADLTVPADKHIGSEANPFMGVLDGKGHTLSYEAEVNEGLFIKIGSGATVKNLNFVYKKVVNANEEAIGALANENSGTISNCTVQGNDVGGNTYAGAITGRNYGTIEYCKATINEGGGVYSLNSGAVKLIGGIAGENRGTIDNCIADGAGSIHTENGNGWSGGIVGGNRGSVKSCIVEGSLKIEAKYADYTGGIAGRNYRGTINDCLVYGNVSIGGGASNQYVGGICGVNSSLSTLKNSFYNASGGISGQRVAAISPKYNIDPGTTENSYWNKDKTTLTDEQGTGVSKIWWLKPTGGVVVPAEIAAEDGLLSAGRSFYYEGKKVQLAYSGSVAADQILVYTVNGNRIEGNELTMPNVDSVVGAVLLQNVNVEAVTLSENTFTYDGTPHNPLPRFEGRTFEEGIDYTVEYRKDGNTVRDCVDAGEYEAIITGIGEDYVGAKSVPFTVNKAKITITADDKNSTDMNETDPFTWTMTDGEWYETEKADIAFTVTDDNGDVIDPKTAPEGKYIIVPSWNTENKNYDATFLNGTLVVDEEKIYSLASGANGTWTKGSTSPLKFTFKSTVKDNETYDHFTGIEVDGKMVPEKDASGKANWTAKSGSVIIELQPLYLETLSVGKHNLTATFDDGNDVTVEFTVKEKSASPKTGDESNVTLWLTLMIISLIGLGAATYYLYRKTE